jgi:predicted phage terminase large subunit-like protein
MLGIDRAGVMFVEADLARRPTTDIASAAADWCAQFRPLAFCVETNQFQELLAGELAHEFQTRSVYLTPTGINNHTNKRVRIRRLGPYLAQRRLRFLSRSPSTRLLVDQLRDFPLGAHDDGPDALEMAIRLAEEICHGRSVSDGLGNRLRVGRE